MSEYEFKHHIMRKAVWRKKRIKPPQALVLHWTAGEGSAERVADVLYRRKNKAGKVIKLGVDFIIDRDGVIWQLNEDIDNYRTAHAGYMNDSTVGVEIVNYAYAAKTPKIAEDRPKQKQRIHGKLYTVAEFYPKQVAAAVHLCHWFCETYDVPKIHPHYGTTLQKADALRFRGILGHYHISKRKTDPGTQIFNVLTDLGW